MTTLAACLTPPGRGAIATITVRGPRAWTVTRELFNRAPALSTAKLPEAPTPGKWCLGWLGESAAGSADQVVLLVKESSPVPWLDVHCHGGPQVVSLLQELYQARGVDIVPWTEFVRGHAPAWQAAAQEVLVHAPTLRTAAIALDQWHGAFVRAIEQCQAALSAGDRVAARQSIERLQARAALGRHLTRPWRVVLAGAPNVGKSSLSNALVGYARSIVAATPGTTRDVVSTSIALDGWPVELSDSAGLRIGGDALERIGITRAQSAMAAADLCLWVVDGAASQPTGSPNAHHLVVINKTDLAPGWDWGAWPTALRVSAKTSAGVHELCEAISGRLVPSPPEPGEAVPYTVEMCDALDKVGDAPSNVGEDVDEVDFQLQQLRASLHLV